MATTNATESLMFNDFSTKKERTQHVFDNANCNNANPGEVDEEAALIPDQQQQPFNGNNVPEMHQPGNGVDAEADENQLLIGNNGHEMHQPGNGVDAVADENQLLIGNNGHEMHKQASDFLSKYLLAIKMPSFLALIRCYSIVGFLIMPITVSYAGLAFGTIGILVLGTVCIHCNHLILQSNDRLYRSPDENFNYVWIVEKAFETGPMRVRCFSRYAKYIMFTMMQLTRMGVCCQAYLFLAADVRQVIAILNDNSTAISLQGYKLIILPVMLFFNFNQQSHFLAIASSTTDYVVFVALVISCIFCVQGAYNPSVIPYITPTPLLKLPLYFGCVMYIFEVTSVILPFRSIMTRSRDAAGSNKVYSSNLRIAYFMYAFIGFFGYLTYGPNVKHDVSVNLEKSWLGDIARFAYIFALFNEYTTQMAMMLQEFRIKEAFSREIQNVAEQSIQIALVLITFGLAWFISDIDELIPLIGAFVAFLVLVCSPILDMLTFWNYYNEVGKWKWRLVYIKDGLLFVFGITIFGTGLYGAIIKSFGLG